ncbi:MAG: PQQ-like beta-propeller repeat protein [Planctomycetes bacterium]|nr:PQQ-like beta-propeller repeat protein [Planctomycetota bacterium]MBL7042663.1 PQQ-like beta-propeller repeat protein [Pirellulaceae bacterium]
MNRAKLRFLNTASSIMVALIIPLMAFGQESGPVLVRSDMTDWSQWRGPRRDGISHETGLLPSWSESGPKRLWTASEIGRGYSSPIVADETIYITGDRANDLIISAFSLDGKLRWKTENGAAWKRSYPGTRSSCTYDHGKLYHMNAHGRLACLDAKIGSEVWAVNVLERFEGKNITWGISESLLIHGDLVFATPCGAKGLVVALNKHTGDTVWATPALDGERPSYASPILINVAGRTLLINSATKNAFAVDAKTGELCWQVPQEDPKNTVTTIPVLAKNELVLTNASRGFGAIFGVRLDGLRGEKTWIKELTISHGSTVCIDGQVYGASGRGVARGWVAADAKTGSIRTESEMDVGSLIYADGRFYCLTQRGMMTLQKLTADGFQTVGSFRIADGKDIWAHPVISNGRLYLRVRETLFCYDIRS